MGARVRTDSKHQGEAPIPFSRTVPLLPPSVTACDILVRGRVDINSEINGQYAVIGFSYGQPYYVNSQSGFYLYYLQGLGWTLSETPWGLAEVAYNPEDATTPELIRSTLWLVYNGSHYVADPLVQAVCSGSPMNTFSSRTQEARMIRCFPRKPKHPQAGHFFSLFCPLASTQVLESNVLRRINVAHKSRNKYSTLHRKRGTERPCLRNSRRTP